MKYIITRYRVVWLHTDGRHPSEMTFAGPGAASDWALSTVNHRNAIRPKGSPEVTYEIAAYDTFVYGTNARVEEDGVVYLLTRGDKAEPVPDALDELRRQDVADEIELDML